VGAPLQPDERMARAETLAEDAAPVAPTRLARGDAVGRYVILDHLASGGMGSVYRAYDPDLDRAIAVKLVCLAANAKAQTAGARARMMREAQALAKLSHPNVIPIYDVGVAHDDVFLAMELVDGKTLRAWMAEHHPADEVLALLREAGRGLAAAHAAGIVHRDFKPENVLVGGDGRVRVVDFGLAGALDRGTLSPPPPAAAAEATSARFATSLTTPLTRPGEMFGTPHYMAPEQFAGKTVDARADQFAFCVTAYEALFGERPFAGDDLATLARHVGRGERKPLPERGDVSPAALDAILRGLAADPDARHPSMTVLLDVLAPAAVPARGPRWPLAVAAAATVAGIAAASALFMFRDDARSCADGRAQLAGAWDDDVRKRVRASFDATRASYAPAAFTKLEDALDAWTERWRAMRVDACRATRERGDQSEHLLDLKVACLDRRRDEVASLTTALAGPLDAAALDRAVEVVTTLPAMDACADSAALLSAPPPPNDPAALFEMAVIRGLLAEAHASDLRGDFELARAKAEVAATRATVLGYPPLSMDSLWHRAKWEEETGRYSASEATLIELTRVAAVHDDDVALARAASTLVWVAGNRQDRHAEADAYARLAGPLVDKTGRPELRADLLVNIGALQLIRGDYAAARASFDTAMPIYEARGALPQLAELHNQRGQARGNLGDVAGAVADMERSLELRRASFGLDHPYVAAALNNVALWKKAQGRYDDAITLAREALAIMERRAPEHSHYASTLQTLGLLLAAKGEHEQALVHFDRALPILKSTKGVDHTDVADLLNSTGFSLRALRRATQALAHHEAALAIYVRRVGPEHPTTADTRVSIGLALAELGRLDEADAAYRRALASYETGLPADSPRLAVLFTNIGELASRRRDHRGALAACTRALAIDETNLGAEHPDLVYGLQCRGTAHAALGDHAPAIAALERAVRLLEASDGDPDDLASARAALARIVKSRDRR
jgi:eukaryotic-like serine/threonine-protein kinase